MLELGISLLARLNGSNFSSIMKVDYIDTIFLHPLQLKLTLLFMERLDSSSRSYKDSTTSTGF